MRTRSILLAFVGALWLANPAQAQVGSLSTIFTGGNNNSVGGGNYYDMTVTHTGGITVTSFDVNSFSAAGTPVTINIWTRPGTSSGFETSSAGWTMVSTGSAISAGPNVPTNVDVTDFSLGTGVTGFALNNAGFAFAYTNGNGTNQDYSNADLSLHLGTSTNVFFAAPIFTPRVWNGTIYYSTAPVPEPTSLALVGIGLTGVAWRRWRKR